MSSATAPLDSTRADVIDGYELSHPRNADYGAVEEFLERSYVATMLSGASAAGDDVLRKTTEFVGEHLATRPFAFGRRAFDASIQKPSMLPTLLYMCLRIKHPKIKIESASALVTDENRAKVRRAVLEMWGLDFNPPKNEGAPENPMGASSPSTGAD